MSIKLNTNFEQCLNDLKLKYHEEFEYINGFHKTQLSLTDFKDMFTSVDTVANITIDPSANSDIKDIRTLINDMSKPLHKLICFNDVFTQIENDFDLKTAINWFEHEWTGLLYMHNATTCAYYSYCYAYDVKQIAEQGLFFLKSFKPGPAQHLTTFNNHILETISWLSNRTSGAVGLPSYLVYSFYFWKKDCNDNYYLKSPEYYRDQCFQQFIYDCNQPYLRITESAFTNISIMDSNYLSEIFGDKQYPDGSYIIDYIDELIEYQKAFMKVVSKTRYNQMMTFPVISFSLLTKKNNTASKFVDEDFAKWCVKHNMEWKDNNFYLGTDVTSLSSCCRLISNISELNEQKKAKGFINSIGGTSLEIGSVQASTINLVRIAKMIKCRPLNTLEKEIQEYIKMLKEIQLLNMKALHSVRNIIKKNITLGLLPNYTCELIKLENQYNTIGITAMEETMREFHLLQIDEFDNISYSKQAYEFASLILDTIQQEANKFSNDKDYSINVEAIPGESANVKLAAKDNLLFSSNLYANLFSSF